ncbi:2Fe-2S iron-sulfur cluster-binding protein [Actinoplanes sp. NPDC051851]|uniref:2Fe-2S iron-sulfur cluster-binding protein n=1 Tax=Actinoplanes sp. NPDC051851 TaxID=3154753 RepID=UPI0034179FA8
MSSRHDPAAGAIESTAHAGSYTARIEPAGIDIEVYAGETLFDAADREGYDWPTICGGQGTCTHCHVRLLDGDPQAAAPIDTEQERRAVTRLARRLYGDDPTGIRLACQLQLRGDVVAEQRTFRGERR